MYSFFIDIISKYNKTENNIILKIEFPHITTSNIISKIDIPNIINTTEKKVIYIKKYLETITLQKSCCSCDIDINQCLMCSPVNEILTIKQ